MAFMKSESGSVIVPTLIAHLHITGSSFYVSDGFRRPRTGLLPPSLFDCSIFCSNWTNRRKQISMIFTRHCGGLLIILRISLRYDLASTNYYIAKIVLYRIAIDNFQLYFAFGVILWCWSVLGEVTILVVSIVLSPVNSQWNVPPVHIQIRIYLRAGIKVAHRFCMSKSGWLWWDIVANCILVGYTHYFWWWMQISSSSSRTKASLMHSWVQAGHTLLTIKHLELILRII